MEGDQPRISVLISCFNSERFIGEALDSVLAQSLPAAEIIVVDDGSTDGSVKVIEPYLARGVQLIRQANGGVCVARNRAFDASSGNHVLFLDSDDVIARDHLKSLLACSTSDDSISFSPWGQFSGNAADTVFPPRVTNVSLPGPDWVLLDWRHVNMTQCGMFLIPRRFLADYGTWCEELTQGTNEDFEFFARILPRARMLNFAPDAGLHYRTNIPGSMSQRRGHGAMSDRLRSLVMGTDHYLAIRDTDEARQVCADVFQTFIYDIYPEHADLGARAAARVRELGGSRKPLSRSPAFDTLRSVVGWRMAKRIHRQAERRGWIRAVKGALGRKKA